MKVIDLRGLKCPQPIIMLRKEFKNLTAPFSVIVLTDNEISKSNLLKFLSDNKYFTENYKKDDHWILEVHANKDYLTDNDLSYNDYCSISDKKLNNSIVVIKNDKMGIGDDDLGMILIQGYFSSISELDKYPSAFIFYNKGVLLCRETSRIKEYLKKLNDNGVKIIICGTCLDYFKINNVVRFGEVSNMFTICELLQNSEKIIYP